MKKEPINVPKTTLAFYTYEEDGLMFYEFDATKCSPPEPMVNALHGLRMLKNDTDRLVGIFFHEPTPLYEKVSGFYAHEATELESGDFKIVFKKR